MNASALVDDLRRRGVEFAAAGDRLRFRPAEAITPQELESLTAHKGEILTLLRGGRLPYGDGQPPPLDRPPADETELRRWMDYTADPEKLAERSEWAMAYFDPAETPRQSVRRRF